MRVAHALTDKAMRSPVVSRPGVATVVLMGGCAPPGGVSTVLAETADTVAEVDRIPAICIEAEAAALDPGAWAEVLGAIQKAIDPRRTAEDGRSASEWCRGHPALLTVAERLPLRLASYAGAPTCCREAPLAGAERKGSRNGA